MCDLSIELDENSFIPYFLRANCKILAGKNCLEDLEESIDLIKKEINKYYNLLILLKSLNIDITFPSSQIQILSNIKEHILEQNLKIYKEKKKKVKINKKTFQNVFYFNENDKENREIPSYLEKYFLNIMDDGLKNVFFFTEKASILKIGAMILGGIGLIALPFVGLGMGLIGTIGTICGVYFGSILGGQLIANGLDDLIKGEYDNSFPGSYDLSYLKITEKRIKHRKFNKVKIDEICNEFDIEYEKKKREQDEAMLKMRIENYLQTVFKKEYFNESDNEQNDNEQNENYNEINDENENFNLNIKMDEIKNSLDEMSKKALIFNSFFRNEFDSIENIQNDKNIDEKLNNVIKSEIKSKINQKIEEEKNSLIETKKELEIEKNNIKKQKNDLEKKKKNFENQVKQYQKKLNEINEKEDKLNDKFKKLNHIEITNQNLFQKKNELNEEKNKLKNDKENILNNKNELENDFKNHENEFKKFNEKNTEFKERQKNLKEKINIHNSIEKNLNINFEGNDLNLNINNFEIKDEEIKIILNDIKDESNKLLDKQIEKYANKLIENKEKQKNKEIIFQYEKNLNRIINKKAVFWDNCFNKCFHEKYKYNSNDMEKIINFHSKKYKIFDDSYYVSNFDLNKEEQAKQALENRKIVFGNFFEKNLWDCFFIIPDENSNVFLYKSSKGNNPRNKLINFLKKITNNNYELKINKNVENNKNDLTEIDAIENTKIIMEQIQNDKNNFIHNFENFDMFFKQEIKIKLEKKKNEYPEDFIKSYYDDLKKNFTKKFETPKITLGLFDYYFINEKKIEKDFLDKIYNILKNYNQIDDEEKKDLEKQYNNLLEVYYKYKYEENEDNSNDEEDEKEFNDVNKKNNKFKEKTDNLFENEDDNESNGGEMENNDE